MTLIVLVLIIMAENQEAITFVKDGSGNVLAGVAGIFLFMLTFIGDLNRAFK